jgi:hypothetical protein
MLLVAAFNNTTRKKVEVKDWPEEYKQFYTLLCKISGFLEPESSIVVPADLIVLDSTQIVKLRQGLCF